MSIERKLDQIRGSDLENKLQIERYQNLIEEIVLRNSSNDLQIVLSHCNNFTYFFTSFHFTSLFHFVFVLFIVMDERGLQAISRPVTSPFFPFIFFFHLLILLLFFFLVFNLLC